MTQVKSNAMNHQYSADTMGEHPQPSSLKPLFPGQDKSLEGIAIRSLCLGIVLSLSLVAMVLLVYNSSALWRLPFFLAALSIFHFLEFWTTAKYNTPAAAVSSFLLTSNGPAYAIAHSSASLEFLLTSFFCPDRSWLPSMLRQALLFVGLVLVTTGQIVRSGAMMQAGQSFNHIVQRHKKDTHVLVTSGLYAIIRHPSYFGFFWWGLGTQLVLGNFICFIAYFAVLWKFFYTRIEDEEEYLIEFFGDDYEGYKKRVGTMMPFIA